MIDPSNVLTALPQALREELLDSYRKIASNYLERRWEPSELNGGKFCEVAYSIVDGAVRGNYPSSASKPSNMLAACQALEREPAVPSRVGDRSLRVLIPRLLPVLYEIRNNRGVGHVGGDVDPNHMDAEAVHTMASWVLAELVRIFHGVSTEEAQEAVDALVERRSPLIWEVAGVRRVLDVELSAKDQVLVLLHHCTGAVPVADLFKWIEYSNASVFRSKVLLPLHKARLIEFDLFRGTARISPRGVQVVEEKLLERV
ncbi:hypothetical protein TSA1_21845 [Bradyrhizobium nitroreducens]|uniref:Uncharacterized protein n=1 Tax=Bradyrhizobium nitroreducens TaxID=709803 RepID=A0A2M6UEU4_9BRAD|nr:hypothetical protein [Bradyrhizobium nitroreducens]PIT03103.1 hypothetical protein TSA1_21845 [Bradyrhizobium nitroreducens]